MTRLRLVAIVAFTACITPATPTVTPLPSPGETRTSAPGRLVKNAGDTTIRVLLSAGMPTVQVSSPSGFMLTHFNGSTIARASTGQSWRIEHEGRRLRAVRPDGVGTVWSDDPMVARASSAGLLSVGGKPYRGDLAFYASDSGVSIVNIVKIDDYLRGVVPLEIGTTAIADSAAVQAQAVTARSYAYIHLASNPRRIYDVTGGTLDQVYGGVAVETPVSSEAVESTRTLVLRYAGRVVNAPYHSTCGGTTAMASEIWRSNDEPYLQSVSDRIPGSGRYYCDGAARFRWSRTIEGPALNAALAQYLANYTSVPQRRPGTARNVTIGSHTQSGRVGTVTITTDRGNFVLRANDVRYVLRPPGGEILNSTYFSVESTSLPDGSIARLVIRGMGYGHGVGMCQSGAIGRARVGQDFRSILRTYYPGTTVGLAE